jgi:hypothetical protein
MGYWTEVKDIVLKGVSLASEGLKEGAETVIDAAKEGIHIVELRKDLFLKQREYHTAVTDLGEVVIDLTKVGKNIAEDSAFKEKLEKAESLEKECKSLEEQIKKEKKVEEEKTQQEEDSNQ